MKYTPEKIRKLRYALGMTQEEFAAHIGYSHSHVRHLENGRHVGPRMAFALDAVTAKLKEEAKP